MKITQVANIIGGQDGAIYGNELFRLNTHGDCHVYDLTEMKEGEVVDIKPIAHFKLDRADTVVPHSNSVCFGCEFYEEGDEYPLLYSNIYNNYAKSDDKMLGTCLVYRVQRTDQGFQTTLVQLIKVGFCEDETLWKASPEQHGDRPYGNFVIDRDTHSYWAFVMRDETLGTRYFKFDLPSVHDGEMDKRLHIKCVTLGPSDILEQFDCTYHRYIQGAILHSGKIYSTEGFDRDEVNRPAIRIIELASQKETYFDIRDMGIKEEPEFIDFYNGACYYGDAKGNLYHIVF